MIKKIAGIIFRNTPWQIRRRFVRLSQQKFTASVAVVVFDENLQVLLLDHVLRPQKGWGIPGGFMNSREQPVEAARREICEETGLNLKNIQLFRVRTVSEHIEFLFRAEAVGTAEVKSLEINAVKWFDVKNLPGRMREFEINLINEMAKTAR